MSSFRQQRVRELVKRALGEIVQRELPVSEAGLVTVADVEISSDFQLATVYVGVVGKAAQKKRAVDLLESKRVHIQALLGKAVVLKYTPVLRFQLDESLERGNRILEIIEEIERESPPS